MTTIDIITLVMSICSVLFTLVTAAFSVLSYSKVIGMEKSTHQIQWMPVEEPVEPRYDQEGNELPTESQLLQDMKKHMYSDSELEQL